MNMYIELGELWEKWLQRQITGLGDYVKIDPERGNVK